jgi:hypothetical protein
MQPLMCISNRSNWSTGRIYETKIDLRDSMTGIYGTGPGSPNPLTLNGLSKNSYFIRFQCGAPPCKLYYSSGWPFVLAWADRFLLWYYEARNNGQLQCNNMLSSSDYYDTSPILIDNNIRYPGYVNYIYFNPYTNSIPKSLAAAGLIVKEGYLVNESEYHSPAKVEIIDPLGRNLINAKWPEENRLLLPQHLHGVLLLRLWYSNGQVVVVRHGF